MTIFVCKFKCNLIILCHLICETCYQEVGWINLKLYKRPKYAFLTYIHAFGWASLIRFVILKKLLCMLKLPNFRSSNIYGSKWTPPSFSFRQLMVPASDWNLQFTSYPQMITDNFVEYVSQYQGCMNVKALKTLFCSQFSQGNLSKLHI